MILILLPNKKSTVKGVHIERFTCFVDGLEHRRTVARSSIIVLWITYMWFQHLDLQSRGTMHPSHVNPVHFFFLKDQILLPITTYATLTFFYPDYAAYEGSSYASGQK